MQFHLNGFKTGNPEIFEPFEQYRQSSKSDTLPNEVDVLIVGCGPAGLPLAAQLAAIEKRSFAATGSRILKMDCPNSRM